MLAPILPLPAPQSDGNLGPIPPAPVTAAPPVATHTRTIGIIHPPPRIRAAIETTARWVAHNGPEFEKRVRAMKAGDPTFNFLIPSDPYHAYYRHRCDSGLHSQKPDSSSQPPSDPSLAAAPASTPAISDEPAVLDPTAKFGVPTCKVLQPPEAEQYTVPIPDGIAGEELDIIKLAAQFAACNGESFLASLTGREHNNPQFYFLKPTHSAFAFFAALASAYSKVLMPPKWLSRKPKNGGGEVTAVLERLLHRLEWKRSQEQARQRAEDEIERERMQMEMIDWHDFVVVESIEFVDDEDGELPVPMMPEVVIRRSKMSALGEEEATETVEPAGKDVGMDIEGEENGVEERKKNETMPPPTDEAEPPMKTVKNWKRPEERIRAERGPASTFVISPITRELISVNEMAEHIRFSLIDPKYKEQKERMVAKIRETTLAADDEISRNIVWLARTRPDIFGTTEEEVSNAVKAEIEKKIDDQPKRNLLSGEKRTGITNNGGAACALQGPASPPPNPGVVPSVRPLPPPPGLMLNTPCYPSSSVPFSAPVCSVVLPPRPAIALVSPSVRPPPPPMVASAQLCGMPPIMMNWPQSIPVNPPSITVMLPSGSQVTPLVAPRHNFARMPPIPPPNMAIIPPPPLPQGMPPPPPLEEAPPSLPDEPEPKRQRLDHALLIPQDQFLAQHPGSVHIRVSVPNVDEGNLRGQLLDITIHSLSETIGNLKEKIAGEIQLPANKQKLSGRTGFLKDSLTLAYYNIGPGETLSLALRGRGGRKR